MKNALQTTKKNTVKKAFPSLNIEQAKRIFDGIDVTEGTRNDYKARIGDFLNFVNDRGGFYSNILLDYKTNLSNRVILTGSLAVATQNKYIATASIFLTLLHNIFGVADLSKDASGKKIKGISTTRQHKRQGLSETEARRILDYMDDRTNGIRELRARALLALLLFQGLRQIEIRRLRLSDLRLRESEAFIQGKGRGDKEIINLDERTVKALSDYIAELSTRTTDGNGYLFQSLSNHKSAGMLSHMTLQREVKALFASVGIEGKTVHGFRHLFVTKLIKEMQNQNLQLLEIAHMSRHKSLDMLKVYNDGINGKEIARKAQRALQF